MRLRYYLHSRIDKGNQRLIFGEYTHKGKKPWRFSTGIRVNTNHWNKTRQRVSREDPLARGKNINLDELQNNILDIALTLKPREFPDSVKKAYKAKIKKDNFDFWVGWESFLKEQANELSQSSLNQYGTIESLLKSYELKEGKSLEPQSMNFAFSIELKNYFEEQGLAGSSINQYLARLKKAIRFMIKAEILDAPLSMLDNWSRSKKKKETARIWLTDEEFEKLIQYQPQSKQEDRAKDVFILQSEIGCRYNELQIMQPDWRQGDTLYFRNRKRKRNHKRTLSPLAIELLEKLDHKIPQLNTHGFNERIREIAAKAGIDTPVLYEGKMRPKHELLSSHAARRTLGNRLLRQGYSLIQIRDILNHESVTTTEIYLDVSGEDQVGFRR